MSDAEHDAGHDAEHLFEHLRAAREEGHAPAGALDALAFAPPSTSPAPEWAAHVESCPACQARVVALREERRRFLQARPAGAFTARVLERDRRGAWWRRPRWVLGLVPVAVAAALLVLVVRPSGEDEGPAPVRFKGGPGVRMEVLVSREGRPAAPLPDGALLRSGDTLRFLIAVDRPGYLFIANQDEAGHFTRYFPAGSSRSEPVSTGEHVLPGGVVLDDARGEERITVLFSPMPLEEQDVEEALRRGFTEAGGLRFSGPVFPGASVSRIHRKADR